VAVSFRWRFSLRRQFIAWIIGGAIVCLAAFSVIAYVQSNLAEQDHQRQNKSAKQSASHANGAIYVAANSAIIIGSKRDNSNAEENNAYQPSTNGEQNPWQLKLSDALLIYFAYCLVVVGWATMRSGEETQRGLERARFFPKGFWLNKTSANDPRPTITYGFVNIGRSPAIVVFFHIEAVLVGDMGPRIPSYTKGKALKLFNGIHPETTLGTGSKEAPLPVCKLSDALSEDDYKEMAADRKIILVKGFIKFRDVFGDSYTQRFAAGSKGKAGPLLGYEIGSYNAEIKEAEEHPQERDHLRAPWTAD
jgi:hypothetical protein